MGTGQYSNVPDFGLMYYNARWSGLGRFAQADTVIPLESQGVQAWDRYAGMNNNPVRYSDPSGHCVDGISTIICVAAFSAIGGALIGAAGYMLNVTRSREEFDVKEFVLAGGTGAVAGLAITAGIVASAPLVTVAGVGAAIGGASYIGWNIATKNDFDSIDFAVTSFGGALGGVALPMSGLPVNPVTAGFVGGMINLNQAGMSQLLHLAVEGTYVPVSDEEIFWALGTGTLGGVVESLPSSDTTGKVIRSIGAATITYAPNLKNAQSNASFRGLSKNIRWSRAKDFLWMKSAY